MRTFLGILTFLPLIFALATPSDVKQAFDNANVGALFSFWQPLNRFPQIPSDIALEFDPTLLLQVVLPQSTGAGITLEVGEQLPRNGSLVYCHTHVIFQ